VQNVCGITHRHTPQKPRAGGVFALDFASIWRFVNIMFIMGIYIYNKINDLAHLYDFVHNMHGSSCDERCA